MKRRIKKEASGKTIPINEQNGYILLSMLIIGALIMCVAMTSIIGLQSSLRVAGVHRLQGNVFNIAEAGKECALAQLRSNAITLSPSSTSWLFYNKPFGIGKYSVRCITNSVMDTLLLQSYGSVRNQSATVEVSCYRHTFTSTMTHSFPAAVVSRADVKTLGNITIDGNDYDSLGSATPIGPGVYAISTCGTYSQGGSSDVYGRGFVTTPPSINDVVEQSVGSAGFPQTPEEVLGVAPGALDAYKTSSFPATPFHAIVYLTSGPGTINGPDLDGSSGIFIYHDPSYGSVLKVIHANFKGILICDQIDKINGTSSFLGAIVTLSNTTAGNAFGNGAANVRYSSQILTHIDQYIWNSAFYVDVLSWKEK